MDTLDLANDYVNTEDWEEFREEIQEIYLLRMLCSIWMRTESTENFGRVFRFPEMVRYSFVTDVQVNPFDSPANHWPHALSEAASSG